MQIRRLIHFIPLLLLLITAGCRQDSKSSPEQLQAEHVKYKVRYIDYMAGDIPTRMLPDVMEAYYSDDYIKTEIQGFFGQFSLIMIADLKRNSVKSLLNFFGNKAYYSGKRGEIPAGIVELIDPQITYHEETRIISGIESKKAQVTTGDSTFSIYYTEDMDIRKPNITTPYYFVDHVLTDFRVQLSYLKMQLTMYEYASETVSSEMFQIPEDYEEVSRENMEQIINSLFTKE